MELKVGDYVRVVSGHGNSNSMRLEETDHPEYVVGRDQVVGRCRYVRREDVAQADERYDANGCFVSLLEYSEAILNHHCGATRLFTLEDVLGVKCRCGVEWRLPAVVSYA